MKIRILTLLMLANLILVQIGLAQVPEAVSFQGIARNGQGACLINQSLALEVKILDDIVNTNVVYREIHNTSTDINGLFFVQMGKGILTSGSPAFVDIDWSSPKWVETVVNGTSMGTIPLLAVPYAFHASRADTTTYADTAIFALNGKLQDIQQADSLAFIGTSNNLAIELNVSGPQNDQGNISVLGAGVPKVNMKAESNTNSGVIILNGANGGQNVQLRSYSDPNHGQIIIADDLGTARISMHAVSDSILGSMGNMYAYGPNSKINVAIAAAASTPVINRNRGKITVNDENGSAQACLEVDGNGNGVVSGDIKSFVMDHPRYPDKEIWYASIEGPEAAAYARGTAQLVNGEAEIQFSEHFQIIGNPQTMTFTTSPRSADSKGLAIIAHTEQGFKVKELFNGTGNYRFDWEAKAVRKGFEYFQIVRAKRE